jgi:hypothetical protein
MKNKLASIVLESVLIGAELFILVNSTLAETGDSAITAPDVNGARLLVGTVKIK